jgi:hypothetical protein
MRRDAADTAGGVAAMAEDEGFLDRWSRLKQARAVPKAEPDGPPDPAAPVEPAAAAEPAEEIDLAALPPIETLGADSDYTQFLKPGVPAELQRRALRRAWVTDREIADFRAPADYDWNFNAPGYGALWPTDNVAEMLQRLALGDTQPAAEAPPPSAEAAAAAPAVAPPPEADDGKVRTTAKLAAAPEDEPPVTAETPADPEPEADPPLPERRPRHGGAVPT